MRHTRRTLTMPFARYVNNTDFEPPVPRKTDTGQSVPQKPEPGKICMNFTNNLYA